MSPRPCIVPPAQSSAPLAVQRVPVARGSVEVIVSAKSATVVCGPYTAQVDLETGYGTIYVDSATDDGYVEWWSGCRFDGHVLHAGGSGPYGELEAGLRAAWRRRSP